MAIIRCKMCGGDVELAPDKTFGTCECCGNTMTFPKVDDDQRASAFNRGNHFRRIGEFDKALAVYERIVREDDTDAEAHWCCALCRFGIEYVEDPATYEWLPTCHRASFDSFLEDVDYLAALEHSDGITRRQYQKDAAKIAEVQRGILATSQNAEPYDVFICYKESDESGSRTRDSLLAQDIYYQLTEQGRKVFFARITLEDVVGTQYEPYIFAALNSAKVMIVVGTKPEYLSAVWVKNEWSRFLALMKKDRSKLLLPCYRDMDPYDLPEQLSVLQSYDMGKIGFIQDLIRGVSKVLDAAKPEPMPDVTSQSVHHQEATPLLRRIELFLEDGEFERADDFCEQVLNIDPENAVAYIGKLQVEFRCCTRDDLRQLREPIAGSKHYSKILRFGKTEEISFIKEISKQIEENIRLEAEQKRKEEEALQKRKLEQIQTGGLDPDEFVDVVCPYCNEILSYPPIEMLSAPVQCPICENIINFTDRIGDVAEFLHMEASRVAEIVQEGKEQEEAEIERVAKENISKQSAEWRALGQCQHCGGTFRGLFDIRCVECGLKKNY